LHEIENPVTGNTFAASEPALDYIVVKIPRWPFDKFTDADRRLGTQMKATGEVMATARSFEGALLKAVRSLPFFPGKLQCIVLLEQKVREEALTTNQAAVRQLRRSWGITPTYKMVDTCAAEFETTTPYYYSAYERENEVPPSSADRVVVLGSGPIRIGQGIEFDYCSVNENPRWPDWPEAGRASGEPGHPLSQGVDYNVKRPGYIGGQSTRFPGSCAPILCSWRAGHACCPQPGRAEDLPWGRR